MFAILNLNKIRNINLVISSIHNKYIYNVKYNCLMYYISDILRFNTVFTLMAKDYICNDIYSTTDSVEFTCFLCYVFLRNKIKTLFDPHIIY